MCRHVYLGNRRLLLRRLSGLFGGGVCLGLFAGGLGLALALKLGQQIIQSAGGLVELVDFLADFLRLAFGQLEVLLFF